MSLTPEKSTRYAGWHAVQHWLAMHLLNVAPRTYVSVDLASEGDTGSHPRVRLACFDAMAPDDWAAEVAAVWEDCPTTWSPVPGYDGVDPFANLSWRTDAGVNVNVYSPRAADLTPYREALVAAGVLRAEPVGVTE